MNDSLQPLPQLPFPTFIHFQPGFICSFTCWGALLVPLIPMFSFWIPLWVSSSSGSSIPHVSPSQLIYSWLDSDVWSHVYPCSVPQLSLPLFWSWSAVWEEHRHYVASVDIEEGPPCCGQKGSDSPDSVSSLSTLYCADASLPPVACPTLLLVSLSKLSWLLLACAVLPIWDVGEYPADTLSLLKAHSYCLG